MNSQIKNITDKDKIYFLPLGGTGEIGMNFNMYCYQNEWLIVDCGVTFKDAIAIGSDVFMPSIEAITKYNFKINNSNYLNISSFFFRPGFFKGISEIRFNS